MLQGPPDRGDVFTEGGEHTKGSKHPNLAACMMDDAALTQCLGWELRRGSAAALAWGLVGLQLGCREGLEGWPGAGSAAPRTGPPGGRWDVGMPCTLGAVTPTPGSGRVDVGDAEGTAHCWSRHQPPPGHGRQGWGLSFTPTERR